jgi:hypothetical protein
MRMKRYFKTRNFFSALFVVVVFAGFAATPGFALDSDETENPMIKEIPRSGVGGDRDFVQEVADQYDFIGTINDVQEEGVVVDDSYFKKATRAKIGGNKGTRVGLMLNDAGEVVLCEPYKKNSR